jgi:hypothetical protein
LICRVGGHDAHDCKPSTTDRLALHYRTEPFGIVQCGRNEFRIYFK